MVILKIEKVHNKNERHLYQSITLLFIIQKTVEKMIINKIRNIAKVNNLIIKT